MIRLPTEFFICISFLLACFFFFHFHICFLQRNNFPLPPPVAQQDMEQTDVEVKEEETSEEKTDANEKFMKNLAEQQEVVMGNCSSNSEIWFASSTTFLLVSTCERNLRLLFCTHLMGNKYKLFNVHFSPNKLRRAVQLVV